MSLIYILEDDESVRELEMYAVSGNGYEVEGFAEPKSFYSALERRKPDLLVIDVMLPVEDGLTITKKTSEEFRLQGYAHNYGYRKGFGNGLC